jgi:hypothetical protein
MAKRRRKEEGTHNQIGNSQSKGVHYGNQHKGKEKQPKKNLKQRLKIIDRAFKSNQRLLLKRFQN